MLVANATRHDKQRYIRDAWISDANVHVQRILRVVPTTVLRSIPSRLHGSMSRKLVPAKELRHYPHCTLLSHSESSINFIYWSTNIYADFHHTRRQRISSVNCLCLADHISVFLMKTMFFLFPDQKRNDISGISEVLWICPTLYRLFWESSWKFESSSVCWIRHNDDDVMIRDHYHCTSQFAARGMWIGLRIY